MFHLDHNEHKQFEALCFTLTIMNFAELKLLVPCFPFFAWTLSLPQSSLDLCHSVLCVHMIMTKGGGERAVDVHDKVHQLL